MDALLLVKVATPWRHDLFVNIVHELCFVIKNGGRRFIGGASDYYILGSVFTSLKPTPYKIFELSISLVHELGHQVLMNFEVGRDPIAKSSHGSFVFSGVRKVLRPVHGSFHAAVALTYMSQFCIDLSRSGETPEDLRVVAVERAGSYLSDLYAGVKALKDTDFSTLGKLVLKDIVQHLKNNETLYKV